MFKEKLAQALKTLLENGDKKNFVQSVEIIVNFRNVNFSKPENRISLDVVLPKGRDIKTPKVAVIGDEATLNESKKAGAELLILPNEIQKFTTKSELKKLAKEYVILVQPTQMANAAKFLGQFLGPRGKVLRPIVGNIKENIERARKIVRLATRGKYLPTIQAFIGTEKMPLQDLIDNGEAVFEAIKTKVPEGNIKSVYVKKSMSKSIRVI